MEASLRARGLLRRVMERNRSESERLIDEAAANGRVFDRIIAEEGHRFVSMSLRVRW